MEATTVRLSQSVEKMNPDLEKERKTATFNVEKLTHIIDGGKEETERRRELEKMIMEIPEIQNAPDFHYMTREEKYSYGLEKTQILVRKLQELGIFNEKDVAAFVEALWPNETAGIAIHLAMFIPTLMNQASDEQQMEWIPKAVSFQMIGTYAQTELGHGTHLRALETTATYDPSTEEFILNSPTTTSLKWWPGGLGKTTNWVIIVAQLYTQGKCYGVHPFMLQTRDMDTHEPMPGIILGDIGPKFGFESMDNGYLKCDHVRIPRTNMLARNVEVLKDGTYQKKVQGEKLSYGAMVFVRAMIVANISCRSLAQACVIATRYSAVRRQSELDPGGPEPQILDFQTQQFRLFPWIAASYAYWFAGKHITDIYNAVNREVHRGNMELMPELHALSSGLKAFTTNGMMLGVEQCRLACGGLGYSHASGLPKIYTQCVPACTYEGENTVLYLQTGRYLLKSQQQAETGELSTESFASYLLKQPIAGARTKLNGSFFPSDILDAYIHRAGRLVRAVSRKHRQLMQLGRPQHEASNMCAVELITASEAHCHYYVVQIFWDHVRDIKDVHVKEALEQLWLLYALVGIRDKSGDFIKDGFMTGDHLDMVTDKILSLLPVLRVNAVPLVDAFDFSDRNLGSILGRFDGNVYDNVYKWARDSPLNKNEVHESYYKHLRPLIKQEDLTSKL